MEYHPVIYGDGTQTRDFIQISDIVHRLDLAADHKLIGIYNLGTGENYDFNMVVDMLNTELGINTKPKYIENLIQDDVYVHETMTEPTKMQKATSWERQISFPKGIQCVSDQHI